MDIGQILGGIKGKVLDAVNFELLKGAYELQNQNIEQLKNNNDAIRESKELLKEQISQIKTENQLLKETIATMQVQMSSLPSNIEPNLSETAIAILQACVKHDVTEFNDETFIKVLSYSRIQFKLGIDELKNVKFITKAVFAIYDWSLTSSGKKYALQIKSAVAV